MNPDQKRPLGGWRQQLALEKHARPRSRSRSRGKGSSSNSESKLARSLLSQWAWGDISAVALQRNAANGVHDGITKPLLVRLAKMGASGRSPQHIQSQIFGLLGTRLGSKRVIHDLLNSVQTCCIPPHAMFKFLWDLSPQAFKTRLGANKVKVREFWKHFLATKDGKRIQQLHPDLQGQTPESLESSIPCDWHNDAGPVSRKRGAFVLNWGSILGIGSELETRFLSASYLKEDGDLPEGVWDVIEISMRGLAEGKVPIGFEGSGLELAIDSDGTVWKALFITALADGEYFTNEVGMQGASHNEICSLCLANRSTHPFTQLGSTASWRSTRQSNPQFMAKLKRPLHGMARWPMFNRFTPRYDPLHVVDHKGVYGKVWGSAVWSLVRDETLCARIFPGCAGRSARIAAINDDLKAFDRAHHTSNRLPKITIRSFYSDSVNDFPCLMGPGVKAAGERENVAWLFSLTQRCLAADDSLFSWHRHRVVECLRDWYKVIYGAGVVLTNDQYLQQSRLVIRFMRSYQWLSYNALSEGRMEWHIVPKFHYFCEMARQALMLNPRFQHTYRGESMVGRIASVWKRSLSGPCFEVVQHTVLKKYLLGFEVALAQIN